MNHVGLVIPIESLCDCNLRKHFYFFFAGIVKLNISCPRSQDCTKWCSQWSILLEIWLLYHVSIPTNKHILQYPKTHVTSHVFCQGKYHKVQNLSSSSVSKASINESCLFSNQGNIVSIYIYIDMYFPNLQTKNTVPQPTNQPHQLAPHNLTWPSGRSAW